MMLFNRDSVIQSASRRFYSIYKSENLVQCQPSGRRVIPSGRPTIQSIIRPDDENFPSGPSSVSRSFEPTPACIRPDVSAARSAFNQPSRRLSPWSGSAKPWYGNYLQRKCNRPDDSTPPSIHGSKQERISAKFLKESRSHSCPSGRPMTTVRTAPRFYQARRLFEPSAYK